MIYKLRFVNSIAEAQFNVSVLANWVFALKDAFNLIDETMWHCDIMLIHEVVHNARKVSLVFLNIQRDRELTKQKYLFFMVKCQRKKRLAKNITTDIIRDNWHDIPFSVFRRNYE